MADTTYGVRIKVTPALGNPWKTYSALYWAPTPTGTKTLLTKKLGTAVWYYDHTRARSAGSAYYFLRWELSGYTSTDYIGPVDAEPVDLGIEV